MSANAKLDEIDARLAAATPADKWLDPFADHINIPRGACWGAMTMNKPDTDLAKHAPADLALLVRLVRMVADADCDYAADTIPAVCASRGDPCWPCRIRRELGGGR